MKVSIYSCKMFRSCSHKDRIRASLADPVNAKLVQQLAEYVDVTDELDHTIKGDIKHYATSPSAKSDPASEADTEDNGESKDNEVGSKAPEEASRSSDSNHARSLSRSEKSDSSTPAEDDNLDGADVSEEAIPDTNDDSNAPSDIANSTSIKASIAIDDIVLGEIKGTLNSDASCAGVSLVRCKQPNQELWIYYEDSINLNNVMTQVIHKLECTGFSQLEFNRLARSDNAIVFLTDSIKA